MRISRFADRHPYWFVSTLVGMVVLIYLLIGTIAYFYHFSNMAIYGLANLCLTVIIVAILTTQGWWRTIGYRPVTQSGDLVYFLVPLAPVFLNLIPGVQINSFRHLLGAFAIALMVAFAEETIFRGLMIHVLKARGPGKAAIITASLFGLTHALNALAGKSALDGVIQICYAAAIGFAYAALGIRLNVLWPLVLTHFLTDFVYFIQKPGFNLPPSGQLLIVVCLTVGFTAYGILVLRHKHQDSDSCQMSTGQIVEPSGD